MRKLLLVLLLLVPVPIQSQVVPVSQARVGSQYFFTDFEWTEPMGIHKGIWEDIKACLGVDTDLEPTDIKWGVAADIIDVSQSLYVYGLAQFHVDEETGESVPYAIVFEEEYGFHATIISHEINHILFYNHSEPPGNCIMYMPQNLPRRYVPQEVIDSVLSSPREVLSVEPGVPD